jgi:hypothetical protein
MENDKFGGNDPVIQSAILIVGHLEDVELGVADPNFLDQYYAVMGIVDATLHEEWHQKRDGKVKELRELGRMTSHDALFQFAMSVIGVDQATYSEQVSIHREQFKAKLG